MKKLITIIALVVMIGIWGCLHVLTAPKEGLFHYTNREAYNGEPLKIIKIRIDKNFGEADQISIDRAISSWNYAMNGYVNLEVVDNRFDVDKYVIDQSGKNWLFIKINSENVLIPKQKDDGYVTLAFVNNIGGEYLYVIRDRLTNDSVYGIMLHEIGHLMGAKHVGERLMYPHYNKATYQCIDYETMIAISEQWGISIDKLNYCKDGNINRMSDFDNKYICPME